MPCTLISQNIEMNRNIHEINHESYVSTLVASVSTMAPDTAAASNPVLEPCKLPWD